MAPPLLRRRLVVVWPLVLLILIAGLLPPTHRAVAAIAAGMNPDFGPAETTVIASGSGFTPRVVLDVLWDGQWLIDTKMDALGNFRITFIVPPDAAVGVHQVTFDDKASKILYLWVVNQSREPARPGWAPRAWAIDDHRSTNPAAPTV